jgi:predicted Zn-dependent protease
MIGSASSVGGSRWGRILIALILAGISLVSYFGLRSCNSVTGAAVLARYDPNNPQTQSTGQVAMLIGRLVNLKFGRSDELEADRLGVRFMSEAGYDPRAMMRVMEILEASSQGQKPPEFFSTHPNPENRIAQIQAAIDAEFPNGAPEGLRQ